MLINKKQIKTLVICCIVAGVTILIILFLFTSVQIGQGVISRCQNAMQKYDGDCTQALASLLTNPSESYSDKNYAIWALGQIGDPKALPVLESLYTGNIPKKEPYNGGVSQYELKKAIKLLKGSFNATGFIWKHKLPK